MRLYSWTVYAKKKWIPYCRMMIREEKSMWFPIWVKKFFCWLFAHASYDWYIEKADALEFQKRYIWYIIYKIDTTCWILILSLSDNTIYNIKKVVEDMLRMEIALFLVMGFIACVYFSPDERTRHCTGHFLSYWLLCWSIWFWTASLSTQCII